jgi:hypothetical protein
MDIVDVGRSRDAVDWAFVVDRGPRRRRDRHRHCGGDMRSTIRALIVANDYLESEVSELMKAVSHAYVRGRFQSYSG